MNCELVNSLHHHIATSSLVPNANVKLHRQQSATTMTVDSGIRIHTHKSFFSTFTTTCEGNTYNSTRALKRTKKSKKINFHHLQRKKATTTKTIALLIQRCWFPYFLHSLKLFTNFIGFSHSLHANCLNCSNADCVL